MVDMGRALASGEQGAHGQPTAAVKFAHTHTQYLHGPSASVPVFMLFPLLPIAFPEARGDMRTLTPSSSFQLWSSTITGDKLLLSLVHGHTTNT